MISFVCTYHSKAGNDLDSSPQQVLGGTGEGRLVRPGAVGLTVAGWRLSSIIEGELVTLGGEALVVAQQTRDVSLGEVRVAGAETFIHC